MPARSPKAKRRWFVKVLIALVILAVAAGLALSRHRADGARYGLGPTPSAPPAGATAPGAPLAEIATT
ncbi:hypothetical protein [Actinoplanes siamensis]|uniref:Uncharacterized protein n=1 Tax=Actinoplanes siamensis TaxID=1223317 RepID=A0A919N3Y7_9ACTN|nr:hypothetical protein [Actinoplanes siamensis]GIF03950.1 hypothetical protein Asi03nite_14880 [Actinoplanes siamensis]